MRRDIHDSFISYRRKKRFRIIAFMLVFVYALTSGSCLQYLSAQTAVQVVPPDIQSLPLEIGKVQDFYLSTKKDAPLFICIQNAHANYEAQKNIEKILDYYQSEHQIDSIYLEGSVDEVDTSFYRAFPLEEVKRSVIDEYVRLGRITGVEEYSIISDEPVSLYGIENEKLYIENVELYVRLLQQRKFIETALTELHAQIGALHANKLSEPLLTFLRKKHAFDNSHQNQSLDYMRYLLDRMHEYSIDIGDYPQFQSLDEISRFQDNIDPTKIDIETKQIITRELIQREITSEDLEKLAYYEIDYHADKITAYEFYSFLHRITRTYGIDIRAYENVNRYYHYVRLSQDIDTRKLFQERKQLELLLERAMAQTQKQKDILHFTRVFTVMQRLLMLKATPHDVAFFQKYRASFRENKVNAFLNEFGSVLVHSTLFDLLSLCANFYRHAEQREKHMVKNALFNMRKVQKDRAMLVLGGYHSRGITQKLKKADASYVVVAPRMTMVPEEDLYEKIVSDYDDLFGIQEGTRGGTVEKFSEIDALPLTQINEPLVKKLFAEIRQTFVDEICEIGKLDPKKNLSDYYAAWNKRAREWTIVEYDSDGKAFFINTKTLKKALREYPLQDLASIVTDFGDVAHAQEKENHGYLFQPNSEQISSLSELMHGSGFSKATIQDAIEKRQTIQYLRASGFNSEMMSPTQEDQLMLIQRDFEQRLEEKEKKGDYTIRVYAVGLGEDPKEIVDIVKAFDWVVHKRYPNEESKWTLEVIGIDINSKPIQKAHAVFKALHEKDFNITFQDAQEEGGYVKYFEQPVHVTLTSLFYQADVLDLDRLLQIGQGKGGDYILNRYGSLDNLNVAMGNVSREQLSREHVANVNVFLTLHNLIDAFAMQGTRYITEPINEQVIGYHTLKKDEDIPVLRIPGAELCTANRIMASDEENTAIRSESLLNRGTGIYRIRYPAFMLQSTFNTFIDLVESQKDISSSGRVRKFSQPFDNGANAQKVTQKKVEPYTEETSLVRRNVETGVKPSLNPVIVENLKRGEMLVFKRIDMNTLIAVMSEYLKRPDEEKKSNIINMMIYGIHLKRGRPNYRQKFREWFEDVEENRLEQYFKAMQFVQEITMKEMSEGLLIDSTMQKQAHALLQYYDTRYMILPSFLGSGALGHIGEGGIYLSLEALTKAIYDRKQGVTYNGYDVETIIQAILLHEASDFMSAKHTDNIEGELFKAIDRFWGSIDATQEEKVGELIFLDKKRDALIQELDHTLPAFLFDTSLITDLRLKMIARFTRGEDGYSVYRDYRARGYFSAIDDYEFSEEEYRAFEQECANEMKVLQAMYPFLKQYTCIAVTGLDRPVVVNERERMLFVDLRSPRFFMGLSLIDSIESEQLLDKLKAENEIAAYLKQAEYLDLQIPTTKKDYFETLKSEYDWDDASFLELIESMSMASPETRRPLVVQWMEVNGDRYVEELILDLAETQKQGTLHESVPLVSHLDDSSSDSSMTQKQARLHARQVFQENLLTQLHESMPERDPFVEEIFSLLINVPHNFSVKAPTIEGKYLLSFMAGILSLKDCDMILGLGTESEAIARAKAEVVDVRAIYLALQKASFDYVRRGYSNDHIKVLLRLGCTYEMLQRIARARNLQVAGMKQRIINQAIVKDIRKDILDKRIVEYDISRPLELDKKKKVKVIVYRTVRFEFMKPKDEALFDDIQKGNVIFHARFDRVVIENRRTGNQWVFRVDLENESGLLCDLKGNSIDPALRFLHGGQRKTSRFNIAKYIPGWTDGKDFVYSEPISLQKEVIEEYDTPRKCIKALLQRPHEERSLLSLTYLVSGRRDLELAHAFSAAEIVLPEKTDVIYGDLEPSQIIDVQPIFEKEEESTSFASPKQAIDYFISESVSKIKGLYPESDPFELEALRAVLTISPYQKKRQNQVFAAVMSRLIDVNDAELLLAIDKESVVTLHEKLKHFRLEQLFHRVQEEVALFEEMQLSSEQMLQLFHWGVASARIQAFAIQRKKNVVDVLGLARVDDFIYVHLLDTQVLQYEHEEPVLLIERQMKRGVKREAFVRFNETRFNFSNSDISNYYPDLVNGHIVFQANQNEVVVSNTRTNEAWQFPFKEIEGRRVLCDLEGNPMAEDVCYSKIDRRQKNAQVLITKYIPEWKKSYRNLINSLGTYEGARKVKTAQLMIRKVLYRLEEEAPQYETLMARYRYIAQQLENSALIHYFSNDLSKKEANAAVYDFYTDLRPVFEQHVADTFSQAVNVGANNADGADIFEQMTILSPELARYGSSLLVELFGAENDTAEALIERMLPFTHRDQNEKKYPFDLPKFKQSERDRLHVEERVLPPHQQKRFPTAQSARNALKKRRKTNTDYHEDLKKTEIEGGDVGLLKACWKYSIPLRMKARHNIYSTPRDALIALLEVEREKRSSTELKKSGANPYLKVRCSKMNVPLPKASLEKYPTKESAEIGFAALREQYPDTCLSATFLIHHDAALLNAMRREGLEYDAEELGGWAMYKDVQSMYDALMAIPEEERSCSKMSRSKDDGGNSNLLHLYYKNRIELNSMGCFLTMEDRPGRQKKYPDRGSVEKKVAWYRSKFGKCTSTMLNKRLDDGGDWTLLIECRNYGVVLDREEREASVATDGYFKYKQAILDRQDLQDGEAIELLWYMMRDGDEEARARFVEYFLGDVIDIVENHKDVSGANAGWTYNLDDNISAGNHALLNATIASGDFDYSEFKRLYKGDDKAMRLCAFLNDFIKIGTGVEEFNSDEWQDAPDWLNMILNTDVPYRVILNYEILPKSDSIVFKEELLLILQELCGVYVDFQSMTSGEIAELVKTIQEKSQFMHEAEQRRLKRLILESFFPKLCPKSLEQWQPGHPKDLDDFMRDRIREAVKQGKFYGYNDQRITDQFSTPKGNKGGNNSGGGKKLTVEDGLGEEFDDPIDRLETMQEKLEQIRADDFEFLEGTGFEIEDGVILTQAEKDAFVVDLRSYFEKDAILEEFREPFAMWLVGSLGHIGIARKNESDVNLLIVTEAPRHICRELMLDLSEKLGGGTVYATTEDNFMFEIGAGLNWDAMIQRCPELLGLCYEHNLGKKRLLGSVEIVSLHGDVNAESSALNRARFHLDETLCQMSQNARLVAESEDGVRQRMAEVLRDELSTDMFGYEYFQAEYQLEFFAKQVVRLHEYDPEERGLNRPPATSLSRRDTETQEPIDLDDAILGSLERGEAIAFTPRQIPTLVENLQGYCAGGQADERAAIELLVTSNIYEAGESTFRSTFSQWIGEAHYARLKEYTAALEFLSLLIEKIDNEKLLSAQREQEDAAYYLRNPDLRIMIVPSLEAGKGLAHISKDGLYLSLELLVKAQQALAEKKTYGKGNIAADTICRAILLHEASDQLNRKHTENISLDVFEALDSFWQEIEEPTFDNMYQAFNWLRDTEVLNNDDVPYKERLNTLLCEGRIPDKNRRSFGVFDTCETLLDNPDIRAVIAKVPVLNHWGAFDEVIRLQDSSATKEFFAHIDSYTMLHLFYVAGKLPSAYIMQAQRALAARRVCLQADIQKEIDKLGPCVDEWDALHKLIELKKNPKTAITFGNYAYSTLMEMLMTQGMLAREVYNAATWLASSREYYELPLVREAIDALPRGLREEALLQQVIALKHDTNLRDVFHSRKYGSLVQVLAVSDVPRIEMQKIRRFEHYFGAYDFYLRPEVKKVIDACGKIDDLEQGIEILKNVKDDPETAPLFSSRGYASLPELFVVSGRMTPSFAQSLERLLSAYTFSQTDEVAKVLRQVSLCDDRWEVVSQIHQLKTHPDTRHIFDAWGYGAMADVLFSAGKIRYDLLYSAEFFSGGADYALRRQNDFLALYADAFNDLSPSEKGALRDDLQEWDGTSIVNLRHATGLQSFISKIYAPENRDFFMTVASLEKDGRPEEYLAHGTRRVYSLMSLIVYGRDYLLAQFSERHEETQLLVNVLRASLDKDDPSVVRSLLPVIIEKATLEGGIDPELIRESVSQPAVVSNVNTEGYTSALVFDDSFLAKIANLPAREQKELVSQIDAGILNYDKVFLYFNKRNLKRDSKTISDAAQKKFDAIMIDVLGFASEQVRYVPYEKDHGVKDFSFIDSEITTYDRVIIFRDDTKSHFDRTLRSAAIRSVNNQITVVTGSTVLPNLQTAYILKSIHTLYTSESTVAKRILTPEAWLTLGYFGADVARFDLIRSFTRETVTHGFTRAQLIPHFEEKLTTLLRSRVIRTAA